MQGSWVPPQGAANTTALRGGGTSIRNSWAIHRACKRKRASAALSDANTGCTPMSWSSNSLHAECSTTSPWRSVSSSVATNNVLAQQCLAIASASANAGQVDLEVPAKSLRVLDVR